jgi:NodT family efflux transporter outer membrane factor (OMF) lipoprotein
MSGTMARLSRRSVLLCGSALVLGGCGEVPLPGLAKSDIPSLWEQETPPAKPLWPARDWWRNFASDELDSLMAKAQSDNLDLAAAQARLLQADAQARIAGASLLPNISLSADAGRSFTFIPNTKQFDANAFAATLGASYELDFWGANRDALTAAEALRHASDADRATVALSVTAGTAEAYFQLLSARDRLAIAQLNLSNADAVYAVTASRVRNGVASPLEEAQQLATLAGQRAVIPAQEQNELQARASLATLIGVPPEGFTVTVQDLNGIAEPEVAPDLTSELLARRPDIVSAEQNLRAAHADVAAARAAFFPAITLTGSGGVQSAALSQLFSGGGVALLGAGLVQTVFDGGRLIAQSDAAKAREQELLADYRKAVIAAFSDVETALGNVAYLKEEDEQQAEQLKQLQRAFDIANARYREGVEDYLSVLDAQRSLYTARDSYAQVKLQRLEGIVTLYRALGGGWRDGDSVAPTVAAN